MASLGGLAGLGSSGGQNAYAVKNVGSPVSMMKSACPIEDSIGSADSFLDALTYLNGMDAQEAERSAQLDDEVDTYMHDTTGIFVNLARAKQPVFTECLNRLAGCSGAPRAMIDRVVNPRPIERTGQNTFIPDNMISIITEPSESFYSMDTQGHGITTTSPSACLIGPTPGGTEVGLGDIVGPEWSKATRELIADPRTITSIISRKVIGPLESVRDHRFFDALRYVAANDLKSVRVYGAKSLSDGAILDAINKISPMAAGARYVIASSQSTNSNHTTRGAEPSPSNGRGFFDDEAPDGNHMRIYGAASARGHLMTGNPYALSGEENGPNTIGFITDSAGIEVPYDPGYAVGTNLRGLPVGGTAQMINNSGRITTCTFYPDTADLLNGGYQRGISDSHAPIQSPMGHTYQVANIQVANWDPLTGATTRAWLGNQLFVITDVIESLFWYRDGGLQLKAWIDRDPTGSEALFMKALCREGMAIKAGSVAMITVQVPQ